MKKCKCIWIPTKERQHGPDQDIPATQRVFGFFAIALDGPCIERSLEWSLIERRID
jgi:hypothetical protein